MKCVSLSVITGTPISTTDHLFVIEQFRKSILIIPLSIHVLHHVALP